MDLIHECMYRGIYKIVVYRLNNRQYVNDYMFDIYDYSTLGFSSFESTREGGLTHKTGLDIHVDLYIYLEGMLKGLSIANLVQR